MTEIETALEEQLSKLSLRVSCALKALHGDRKAWTASVTGAVIDTAPVEIRFSPGVFSFCFEVPFPREDGTIFVDFWYKAEHVFSFNAAITAGSERDVCTVIYNMQIIDSTTAAV